LLFVFLTTFFLASNFFELAYFLVVIGFLLEAPAFFALAFLAVFGLAVFFFLSLLDEAAAFLSD